MVILLTIYHAAQLTSPQQPNIAEEYIDYIFTNPIPKAISIIELTSATANDPILISLKHRFLNEQHDPKLTAAYDQILTELAITNHGIIIRGHCVIIPQSLQYRVILLAHEGHQGIVKTKELLRSNIWLPNIDSMVAEFIQSCFLCQINNPKTDYAQLTMSILSNEPWQDLACDF